MGKSKIEWTDKVWNPVTGCTKVSDGCKFCYAERLFPRIYGNDRILEDAFGGIKRKFTDIKLHHDRLEQPLHWKKPSMIFVNSMSDLFHEEIPEEFIISVIDVCHNTDRHIFQILTKRPERAKEILNNTYKNLPDNIWLGASVENQKTADERIPILNQVPAKIRWLSIEPYINEIEFLSLKNINWVVIGAESGSNRRECKIEWIDIMVKYCKRNNVSPFVKQIHLPIPLIKQKSAGKKFYLEKDINKFPEHLQIREFPNVPNNWRIK